jgi:hypothetical protein
MHVATSALDFRQSVNGVAQLRTQQVDVDTGFGQQATERSALLIEQCHHNVRGLDELMILADGKRLRLAECHLKFAGQFIQTHETLSLPVLPAPKLTLK